MSIESQHPMHDLEEQLEVIWSVLDRLHGDTPIIAWPLNDERWDKICLAMAIIREELGLPDLAEYRGADYE